MQSYLRELLEWSNDTLHIHDELTEKIRKGRPKFKTPFQAFINTVYWNYIEHKQKLVGVSANQDKEHGGPFIEHILRLLSYIKTNYTDYYKIHKVVKRDCSRTANSIREVCRSINLSGMEEKFKR